MCAFGDSLSSHPGSDSKAALLEADYVVADYKLPSAVHAAGVDHHEFQVSPRS